MATSRAPSLIPPGPAGSWPYRYDHLVQPVLDRACVDCHGAGQKPDLTPNKSYAALVDFGKPSLRQQVMDGYRRGSSVEGAELAGGSALLAWLQRPGSSCAGKLDADGMARVSLWLDLYGQHGGAFSAAQEQELVDLRARWASLLTPATTQSSRTRPE